MINKRGQFYLIVAVIIIVAIIGITAVSNYVISPNDSESIKLYELSKDLRLEGESVINYGLFNDRELDLVLQEFTQDYGGYINDKENDIYFVYGNEESVKIIGYIKQGTGSIGLNIGGSASNFQFTGSSTSAASLNLNPEEIQNNPNVLITIGTKRYPFEIKRGENFFFIIRQPIGGNEIGVSS